MVVSPPVRALGIAGSIVGMVPLVTAQIVGGAVDVASKLAAHGMSKGRSEMFIREANKKIFAPRGMRVDIVKLEVVARVAGIPGLGADGKVNKDAKLLAPIDGLEADLSAQQRRLIAFAPWTSPLELIPSDHQDVPDNMFAKIHAAASERQRSKEETKMLEKRAKAQRKGDKRLDKLREDFDKDMDKLNKDEAKVRRKEAEKPEKMASELRKLEKERGKVQREYDEKNEGAQGGEGKSVKKDKEEAAVRKILWLLIRNQDAVASRFEDQAVTYD